MSIPNRSNNNYSLRSKTKHISRALCAKHKIAVTRFVKYIGDSISTQHVKIKSDKMPAFSSLTSIVMELLKASEVCIVSVSMMLTKRRRLRSLPEKFKILMKSEVKLIPSALVCVKGAIACDIKCLIRSKTIRWAVKTACKIKCKSSKGYCKTLSRPHRLPQASAISQCIISIQKCLQGSSRVQLMSNNSK